MSTHLANNHATPSVATDGIATDNVASSNITETAIFGGGCFWCTEAIFLRIKGVIAVQSGYSGGHLPNPNYTAICSGQSGHAEVIEVKFNPQIINYVEILHWHFATHDPTTLNQQGADRGTQYRSIIFPINEKQMLMAQAVYQQVQNSLNAKNGAIDKHSNLDNSADDNLTNNNSANHPNSETITANDYVRQYQNSKLTTEIKMLEKFYPAENYHQNYFAQNTQQGYCQAVIAPKLKKLLALQKATQ